MHKPFQVLAVTQEAYYHKIGKSKLLKIHVGKQHSQVHKTRVHRCVVNHLSRKYEL